MSSLLESAGVSRDNNNEHRLGTFLVRVINAFFHMSKVTLIVCSSKLLYVDNNIYQK